MSASKRTLIQPNAQNEYKVDPSDLPLACPMPEMYLWKNATARLSTRSSRPDAKCPYCGAEYTLSK